MLYPLIIILIIIAIPVAYFISIYNKIITLKNRIKNSWSQIDVQLKRRYDLIPNLVETVKGYMEHEKETLELVIKARSAAMSASTNAEQIQAENELGSVLNRLLVLVEDYPDLKANENFLELKEELVSTENRIAFARQNYNDQVMFYNNIVNIFPSSIVARMSGAMEREYFELSDLKEREPVNVSFK